MEKKVKLHTAIKASYGYKDAMKNLNKKGYVLDKDLSNHNEQVYYKHKKGGGKKLLYTVAGTHNLSDVGTDVALAVGKLKNTKRYKEADEILQKAKAKHRVNKATIAAHSLGGSIAGYIAGNDDDVYSYNKGATIGQPIKHNESAYRYSGDLVSILNKNTNNMNTLYKSENERYHDLLNNTLSRSHSGYLMGPFRGLINAPISAYKAHDVDRIKSQEIYI
jgi:hypothetical protein